MKHNYEVGAVIKAHEWWYRLTAMKRGFEDEYELRVFSSLKDATLQQNGSTTSGNRGTGFFTTAEMDKFAEAFYSASEVVNAKNRSATAILMNEQQKRYMEAMSHRERHYMHMPRMIGKNTFWKSMMQGGSIIRIGTDFGFTPDADLITFFDYIQSQPTKSFMENLSAIAQRSLDKDIRTLIKAGLMDKDLRLTKEGWAELTAMLFEANKAELVKIAEEKLAEESGKNGQ